MLRVICTSIITIYILSVSLKMHSICVLDEIQYNKSLKKVLDRVKSYFHEIQRHIGLQVPEKLRLKNDFINFVKEGLKTLQTPTRLAKKVLTKLAPSVQPKVLKKKKAKIIKQTLNAEQMIVAQNYKVELHTVITSDGYILTVHRVLPNSKLFVKQTVMLHHGLLGSAEDWLLLGPGMALPYLLIDQGYDVWLLNARGNRYSRVHSSNNTESLDFWNFSWHEIGIYDLPAVITYINEYTNNTSLHYVGHSMGATVLLVLLSTMPEYNKVLKSAIFLAPLAFMQEVQGPLKYFAKFRKAIEHNISLIEGKEFIVNKIPEIVIEKFCSGSFESCHNLLLFIANGGIELLDKNLEAMIISRVPAGTSTKAILHYMQLMKSGKFRMYDYGHLKNLEKYKQKKPPNYNLQTITLPISLFTSPMDWLSTTLDVTKLLSELQSTEIHHIIRKKGFNHLNFVWSKEAPDLIYFLLINILDMSLERKFAEPISTII